MTGKTPTKRLRAASLWTGAVALTAACLAFQDRTGPTHPLEGALESSRGRVAYLLLRSETIGRSLLVMLKDPVPEGVSARVRFRRFRSHDEWREAPLVRGAFSYERRGRKVSLTGQGAKLPSLAERAGKYEYQVFVSDGKGEVSVTGERRVLARYKAAVPGPLLLAHVIVVFASMALALRTTLGAAVGHEAVRGLTLLTLGSLVVGAFILGPFVQWYAFGVFWSGVPLGYDWTDNKVLVELVAWGIALYRNTGKRRSRWAVLVAGLVTLAIYFIPHSVFGSEFDYRTGVGHGTAG